jgi:hypothetical protein
MEIAHLGAEDASEERSLTISSVQSTSRGVTLSEDQIVKLRENREKHRYKSIWTKDPHGGPYKKVF